MWTRPATKNWDGSSEEGGKPCRGDTLLSAVTAGGAVGDFQANHSVMKYGSVQ